MPSGAVTRPPAVSEDLFLRLKALFESLIVKGLDFRAEFDKFDDSFSGNRVALRGVLPITVVAHSCMCVCGADAVCCHLSLQGASHSPTSEMSCRRGVGPG